MNQLKFQQRIFYLLGVFAAQVEASNAASQLDVNKIAEDVLIPIFSEVFDLQELVNLNAEGGNYEGIDLGDRRARVAFQITSTTDNKKIKKTLRSIVEKKYYEDYERFIIYDLTTKQGSYSGAGWCEIVGGKFNANKSEIIGGKFAFSKNDIRDYRGLSAAINRLSLEKIQKIAAILESQFGEGKAGRILEPNFAELCEACRKVTAAAIKQTLFGRQTIRRESARAQAEKFLKSAVRYCFVTGASAVGKSTALATETEALQVNGWTTLLFSLLPEKGFSLEYAKDEIRKSFSPPLERLEWEQIVKPWNNSEGKTFQTNGKRLMIILDGLEVAEPSHIAAELSRLHQSLAATSPAQVKVILSCRDTQFEGFLRNRLLPFYNPAAGLEGGSLLDYVTFVIKDFNNAELDAALTKIGATDLLSEWDVKGNFNSHAATLRSLLKHPGTFEHYADLYARRQINRIQAETWSSLIEKRLDYCLREVERETGVDKKKILGDLIKLAEQCREQKARDFAVDSGEVRAKFPGWFAEENSPLPTVYAALLKGGILEEKSGLAEQKLAAFRITDAGAYLLSFALETEFDAVTDASASDADGKDGEGKIETVSAWFNEGWSYSPVIDAVLALIDRLSDSADPERRKELLPLLDALILNHHHNSLFRLMKPSVLEFVFRLIESQDDGEKHRRHRRYDYFEAAREIRYSMENEELLRRNFADLNASARELAIELTGIYGLARFVPRLVELLADEEQDVRSAVYKACGRIGVPAIDALLTALDDTETSADVRQRVVWALNNIGHLNDRVSKSLSGQFEKALAASNVELTKTLLLAAAHLRDRRQSDFALQCLTHEDDDVIWKAAKFFTEAPDEKAFEPLRNILGEIYSPTSQAPQGRWHFDQVIAALVKIDREKIALELLRLFEKVLKDFEENPNEKHIFSPSRIAELAAKHDLPDCYPILFAHLARLLQKSSASAGVFHLTEELEKVWNPGSLEKLISAQRVLEENGTDVARLFVGAVLPHNQENDEDDYGDRLNQASHLGPAIKSFAPNFVIEAGRLLPNAPYFTTKELSRYFWIIGDERAEDYLLAKLDAAIEANKAAEDQRKNLLPSDICRALGACGAEKSAKRILSFLAEDAEGVTRNFAAETLVPLLVRKVVELSALAELAENENNNWVGRAVCVEALARYDAPEHLDLFSKLAENRENNPVLRDAVIALGVTRSPHAVKPLRLVLRDRKIDDETKGYAARALSLALDAKVALPDIEEAFCELKSYDQITVKLFVDALTHFGEQSSIKILKQLENAPPDISRYAAEVVSAFAKGDENEKEVIEKLEESTTERHSFFDRQSRLVRGLLRNPQNHLLMVLSEHLEKDRLNESSRWQISNFLRGLAGNSSVDRKLVIKIVAHLVCDHEPSLRYNVLSILSFLDEEFCRDVYEFLADDATADEWTRACAVESLGYWNSDESKMQNARYDRDILVRRAADLALAQRAKRRKLEYHFTKFQNEKDGLARLSSFICLLENGDSETLRRLAPSSRKVSLQATYDNHLKSKISERLDRKESDLQREQVKRLRERSTIWFD